MFDDLVLNPILANCLAVTFVAFGTGTFVIAVDHTVRFICTITYKHRITRSTEQFSSQQIPLGRFRLTSSMFVLFHTNGNPFKNVFGNDSRDGVRNYDLLICILTDISAVGKYTCKRVFVEAIALGRADASCIQIFNNVGDGLATCVSAEHFNYKRSFFWIGLIMLFLVYHIAERNIATVETSLESILGHASRYLFSQISGIVFRHTFKHRLKNDAFRTLGDGLCCRNNFHIVLTQHRFILCRIVTVARESVEFPYDNNIKALLRAVLDHTLKLRTVIGLC